MNTNQVNLPVLSIQDLSISYGAEPVLSNINLAIQKADIACVLGPSGSGKTSLLRAIAGFIEVANGSIDINGQRMSDSNSIKPPNKRSVGVVFQDFALFPHLTVQQNIEFGLGKLSRDDKQATAMKYMHIMGIAALAHKYPADLSGGQQQRVAIARAVAPQPDILLMDEAFSSLDPTLREQVARDVREIIQQLGLTAILVTHDQQEAFAFADKIAVVANGFLQQFSSAYNLYHEPTSYFVAKFIGEGAFIEGQTVERAKGWFAKTALGEMRLSGDDYSHTPTVKILLRPDDVIHDDASPTKAIIKEKHFRGAFIRYELSLSPSNEKVLCFAPSHHDHSIGSSFGIRAEVEHVISF
ncbi:spermidine/putrescine import ATP-binding protein PotA [Glaciecola punicea ACAM 611]|uniref:Spermidine/putrescine import ATP-binding protein PotA n=1 Tax=Glaciecola punicea ACAM 611 TaxID=1121923 RepID=H5TBK4_9ALTE|nr:ABC transporter ATP-binding protein [Glaciecola punicea]OFA30952.1 ABC transporter ATP-binding protein [Glaciecola punicea]GAB55681.1 spermidine/putrescine import ATP-binding protein PotA [Glaciecola punicea ACAM 611]